MPSIGAPFKTFLKKDEAIAFANEEKGKNLENKSGQQVAKGMSILPLVIKADTAGSLEAITNELEKISRERIVSKIILSGVGDVGENDVKSALTTAGSIVINFNTKVDPQAALLAERSGIKIFSFNIIYELTDKVKEFLSEREPRIEMEEVASTIKVLKIFSRTKNKQVLGGRVLSGIFKRGATVKIVRREAEIGQGKIKELQQSKITIDSVDEGSEFGAMIESKIEIVPGDVLNAVVLVTK